MALHHLIQSVDTNNRVVVSSCVFVVWHCRTGLDPTEFVFHYIHHKDVSVGLGDENCIKDKLSDGYNICI